MGKGNRIRKGKKIGREKKIEVVEDVEFDEKTKALINAKVGPKDSCTLGDVERYILDPFAFQGRDPSFMKTLNEKVMQYMDERDAKWREMVLNDPTLLSHECLAFKFDMEYLLGQHR